MAKFDPEAMAGEVVAAARGFIRRSLDPVQETVRGLLARADKISATIESVERRLSRQGQHLAELERKMQSVLRKVGGE